MNIEDIKSFYTIKGIQIAEPDFHFPKYIPGPIQYSILCSNENCQWKDEHSEFKEFLANCPKCNSSLNTLVHNSSSKGLLAIFIIHKYSNFNNGDIPFNDFHSLLSPYHDLF